MNVDDISLGDQVEYAGAYAFDGTVIDINPNPGTQRPDIVVEGRKDDWGTKSFDAHDLKPA